MHRLLLLLPGRLAAWGGTGRAADRHELGASGPVAQQPGQPGSHGAGRFELDAQLGQLRARVGEALLVAAQLLVQLEDALDAREVDPLFLGQALHFAQGEHVAQRVPAALAAGPAG